MLWVDVLNRSLDWESKEAVEGWLRATGQARPMSAREFLALGQDLSVLRASFAAPHLGRALGSEESHALSQWLATVTLAVPASSSLGAFELPGLTAARRVPMLPAPLEMLLGTALVQILSIPGAAAAGASVERCQGLCRGEHGAGGFAPADEELFAVRAEIPAALRDGPVHQCPRLVESERGGHFCSKACSNASFAARKAAVDPRYFAAKQERYRRRREPPRPPQRPGAFVFID